MAVRRSIVLPPLKKPDELQPLVEKALTGIEFESKTAFDELIVTVPAEKVIDVSRRLKSDEALRMDYLRCLSGVDLPEGLEVVYHLYSVRLRHKMVLKALVSKDEPKIASVCKVWKGADWHEREAAEMFGLEFMGHPHLITLLLEEGFQGHPLLKSFKIDDIPGDVREADVKDN